jgi:competence protein ComEC
MRGIELLKKPIFWLVLTAVLLWGGVFSLPDNRLHLIFCDVGQGDAILITYRQTQVLIDGGPNNRILECLSNNLPFWDRTIEMVVLTHPQADHFTGLIDVIKRYNVKQFVGNSIINDSAGFWEFYQAVLAEKAKVYSPKSGDRLKIGPINFLVLWPSRKLGDSWIWSEEARNAFFAHENAKSNSSPTRTGKAFKFAQKDYFASSVLGATFSSDNINNTSIVLQLSFGNFDSLFTGDIDFDVEKQINLSTSQQVKVLKVAHHGSKYSTGEEFLKKIKPQLAVISVGKNSFGHPTKEVIEKLSNLAIKILRTDQEGEIEVVSDGKNWYTTK